MAIEDRAAVPDGVPQLSSAGSSTGSVVVPELTGSVEASVEVAPIEGGTARIPHQDKVRRLITIFLLCTLAAVIAGGFVLTVLSEPLGIDPGDVRVLAQLFFTAVLTLVSTVIGFYFGSETKPNE